MPFRANWITDFLQTLPEHNGHEDQISQGANDSPTIYFPMSSIGFSKSFSFNADADSVYERHSFLSNSDFDSDEPSLSFDRSPTTSEAPETDYELLRTISSEFIKRYGRPMNIARLLLALCWHVLFSVMCRRIYYGPKRPEWSLLHEIIVETMQFNYKWHLKHASQEAIPYDAALKDFKGDAKMAVLERLNMREEDLRSYCCAAFFQFLTSLAPLVPYWPWAICERVVLERSTWLREASHVLVSPRSFEDLTVDVVTHRSVKDPERVVLFAFGGAYNFKVEASWRSLAMHLSRELGATVVIPHYRLAPHNPFPCALDDLLATYMWISSPRGLAFKKSQIVLFGESAGAGALVSLCLRLRQCNVEKPQSAVLLSPWIDLTCSEKESICAVTLTSKTCNSWTRNYPNDILHIPIWPFDLASNYVTGVFSTEVVFNQRVYDPLVSPHFATDLELDEALPRVLIQAGDKEYLVDDSISLAKRISRDCFSVERIISSLPPVKPMNTHDKRVVCEVYADMTHVFQIFFAFGYKPSVLAISRACKFITQQ